MKTEIIWSFVCQLFAAFLSTQFFYYCMIQKTFQQVELVIEWRFVELKIET